MDLTYQPLKDMLCSIVALSEQQWAMLSADLSIIHYAEKTLFHSSGEHCDEIFFLKSGLTRAYLIDINGRDYTWSLHFNETNAATKNLFVTDYASVIKNQSSKLYFETISAVELIRIPVNTIQALFEQDQHWQKIGRILAEEAFYSLQQRTLSLLTLSASTHYQQLLRDNARLLSIIPDHIIASYLGVTPQSLSRIKTLSKLPYDND